MKPTECEVDGVKYEAKDNGMSGNCNGCVGKVNGLCESLPLCFHGADPCWFIIWIKKEPQ